ncbi:MAG: LPS assembly protein LptD [Verrucomicrobia bacterium]|jgi:lipopolysaccharide assembly outer membrane protein LptD (OstA)|nr:LPS assembly protein LptD [Verrucomicrobiota bacterium]
MTKLRYILTLALWPAFLSLATSPPPEAAWEVEALTPEGRFEYDMTTGVVTGTNGVLIKYSGVVLTAERATVNQETGDTEADGRVRIQRDDQIWAGEHVRYNFKTRLMEADQFRTGKTPVFAAGEKLRGDVSNRVYTAHNAYVTSDDITEPFTKVRASYIRIIPGKSIQARNAVLHLGGVPVFYFPFYQRALGYRANNFSFMPGYRSRFGPFLLGSYNWFFDEQLDGTLHLDYRVKRGVGGGADANLHLGRWGELGFKYYYLHDEAPDESANGVPVPDHRQRFYFGYDATPFTNFNVKAAVRYESDPLLSHDFFESEYRRNPQPRTFVELNQLWDNFSLDAYVQPRVNDFYETVERLPDIKFTAFRQQLGATPVFYESESSAGWYRREFAELTNSFSATNNFSAVRADTYHQLTLPQTFFGWLNVTPRVGGRLTYYGEASGPGGTNDEAYRGVFNTGAEVSFKASRVWPDAQNKLLAVQGLRHIVEPSVNYVYVPQPHPGPPQLPQFDYELPSLRLLPIEYPDYNAIDSIDSQNVIRFGLRNRLQTKRGGRVENLLSWDVYTDWRLRTRTNQTTFADLYSDLIFRPRSWITLESQTRYDIDRGVFRLAFHNLTLQPNDNWSWGLGHWYLRDDFSPSLTALGQGNNLIRSTLFYRLNENWALRASQHFEARTGRMEEQFYTLYRDFRSWTGALTFRVRDNSTGSDDYTVAFTFSLKAMPRYGLGGDAVRPEQLLGY